MTARFEEHANKHPDDRAVVAGSHALTYRELNETANRLAWELRAAGAGPETMIGVRTRRDLHLATAVLAVAKAGACFLPLDPEHPLDRQAFLLRDAGARLLLESPGVPAADLGLPVVRTDAPSLSQRPATDPPVLGSGDNLLYLLYTSGSTGVPKGIAMHLGPQVDQMEWSASAYRDRPVALHYFPITSDVGYFELFSAWWSGGTVVIADEAQRLDVAALAELLVRHGVDKVLLPVVALDRLARHLEEQGTTLPALREVITTGERQVITPPVRRMFAAMPQVVLDNHYGSTEVNVVTAPRLRAPAAQWPEFPPVGRPVGKARIYVLDDDLLPCPIGVVGQIHVGGPPPARGYRGRPALTAAAFVPDPFSPVPGARMYRLGDLGRWRPDGTLECLGRLDFQVKVHGYRVEPGEIEAVLRERPGLAEVAVVPAEPGADDPRLVAYLVAEGTPPAEADLRAALVARLPAHMVPRAFVFLDRFPLSANGKLDRRRLPAPVAAGPGQTRPLTPTETAVAGVWAAVLGVDGIGPHDDFFGLGGHSLLVAQVVHRIRAALDVELPLQAVFETPGLAALAARIDHETGTALPQLRPFPSAARVPLSYSQRRLWFLDRMSPESSVYHNVLALRLRGPLDTAALTAALDGLAERHAVLRTTYPVVDAEPYQLVDPAARPPLRRVDLREVPEDERESAARRVIEEERVRRIDLETGPVARYVLLALGAEDHVLCLVAHHLITDRGTDALYVRELTERYAGAVPSGEPSLTYADYARWQRELEAAGVFEPQFDHWRAALDGAPPALELATDFERPATLEEIQCTGRTRRLELPGTTVAGLTGLARDANATLFMTTLALFGLVLSTHTLRGQDDIVVGVPVEGRVDPRLDDVMGMFVNTLPIRIRCTPDRTFRELLAAVRDTALGAFGNQDLPFEHLVERLRPERDLSRSPLFQAMFQLQHAEPAVRIAGGLAVEPFETPGTTAKFDLSMGLVHSGGTVRGVLSYPAALFAPDTIAMLADRFVRLAAQVAANPDLPIRELEVVSPVEWDAVLRRWNDTAHPVPATTLPALIEQRAALVPEAVAVECASAELTYSQLNARANALARRLVLLGAGPERVVAVLLRRSADLLPALLAVLKSGAAYLPVDPDHPRARVADLMADSAPVLTLTTRADLDLVPAGRDVLVLDDPVSEAEHDLTDADRLSPLGPQNAAYVMYTSGSTGRPKAVVVSHESVVNRLLWTQDRLGLDGTDVVLQKTPLTFDVSVWELFWPLVAGARLVVAEPGGHADPAYLARIIRDRGVTTAHFVPSALRTFLEGPGVAGCSSLRRVLCSGEALTPAVRDEFRRLVDAELHNLYGPTEAAIDVTHHRCEPGDGDVPIGRPVWNTRLYVLDETLQPVRPGTAGELHIGGVQVARGYLGDPRQTAERFVPDPFGPPGAVLHRTGDLVRLGHDGALRHLGRLDDQVKIRGVRVEPAEVEQVLQRHHGVRSAAVVPLPGADGQPELVAYVAAPPEVTPVLLEVFLRAKLPASMLPARYVVLDELPLTTSGKLDRRALPAPAAATGDRRPRTPVEDVLCDVFRRILGVAEVGVDDNFFALGGHSLAAVSLTAQIRSTLGVEIGLRTVFTSPTPAALARLVADQG
jgi:amino acid adenylation domain-containing protein